VEPASLVVRTPAFSPPLRTETINVLRGRVHVVVSATEPYDNLQFGHPKTYKRRAVPFPQTPIDELTMHLTSKASDDFVFTSSRGGPLRHPNFYARHFRPAVLRACHPEAVQLTVPVHRQAPVPVRRLGFRMTSGLSEGATQSRGNPRKCGHPKGFLRSKAGFEPKGVSG